jgi:HD-GYP domain-containing protein (c-di-GMP phosphodiesterase class II)
MVHLRIRLKGLAPPVEGLIWEGGGLLRVGRTAEATVHIPDSSLSRLHAELAPVDGAWVVRDLGSTNGTFLNGEPLGRATVQLRPQDILQFGQVPVTVTDIRDGTAAAPPAPTPATARAGVLKSWEDLSPLLLPPYTDAAAYRELLAQTAQLGRAFNPCASLDDYLNAVLSRAAEILDARQGCMSLLGERPNASTTRVTLALGGAGGRQDWDDRALADAVLARGYSLLFRASPQGPGPAGSAVCALLRVGDRRVGTLSLARGAEQRPLEDRDLHRADALALSVSPSIDSMVRLHEQQQQVFLTTLNVLAQVVQMRDDGTGNHAQRVTDYALLLAEELGLGEAERLLLRVGTPLHDLGKVGIRDAVLRKPSLLTPEEAAEVRAQIVRGASLLEQVPSLAALAPIVRNVHERWDGRGYPDGLAGERIPLLARVVAVADAFDAMTTSQPYRAGLPLGRALEEIGKGAGSQFDPDCAAGLVRLRERLEEMAAQRRGVTRTIGVDEIRKARAALLARGAVGGPG